MTKKLESQLVGVAGEYLVTGELSLRGYIASITLRNSRGIDIIASDSEAKKTVSIQVKTNSDGGNKWRLTIKSEEFYSKNHFYVFVAIKGLGTRPAFHIVPSEIVAKDISKGHSDWLKGKKKDGSARKDSNIRGFMDSEYKYLEAWNLLGL